MSHARTDGDAIGQALWVNERYAQWRPDKQAALVRALIQAMGSRCGPQPALTAIAAELGIRHQTLYRMLRRLENKGVVVRSRATIEIRLEAAE